MSQANPNPKVAWSEVVLRIAEGIRRGYDPPTETPSNIAKLVETLSQEPPAEEQPEPNPDKPE